MKKAAVVLSVLCFSFVMAALFAWVPVAKAESGFYTSSCAGCHQYATTISTCAGCHAHGIHSSSAKSNLNLTGTTNKTTYAPGETVSVTIDGDYRTGWVRAILYDQDMVEKARSTGPTGMGGGASFPITLTAPAPTAPGTYTWNVAWYGNQYDKSGAFFSPRWTPDPGNPNHGQEIVSTNSFAVAAAQVTSKLRVYRNGQWYMDMNSNRAWDTGTDVINNFGIPGDIPVTGDWNNAGSDKIGVFRNGQWYLDMNGNGAWDTGTDVIVTFGIPGDIPVAGDWNNTGAAKIGVFRNGQWYLDMTGNRVWDTSADAVRNFGIPGDIPVTGDWNNTGAAKIGVFRNGQWYLDMNGNGVWDTGTDVIRTFGILGDVPVTGDWDGTGAAKIGVFRNGQWYLDMNGNGAWDTGTDVISNLGIPGDIPLTGK